MACRQPLDPAVPVSWGSPRFRTTSVGPFEVTDAFFPRGATLPRHTHDRTVVAVTLSGRIESKLPGRVLLGRPDYVWTEPVGDAHSNRVGPDGARVVVVQPDPSREDFVGRAHPLLDGVHNFRHGGIAHIARRLVSEIGHGDATDALMIEGLALEIIAHGTRRASLALSGTWYERSLELIHDTFRRRSTIKEIADEVGLHPAYFARAFKKRTGVTVGQYVRRLRLDWAACTLRDSEEPIGRIAIRAGFADQSHFTRAFSRHVGMTPGRYRKHLSP